MSAPLSIDEAWKLYWRTATPAGQVAKMLGVPVRQLPTVVGPCDVATCEECASEVVATNRAHRDVLLHWRLGLCEECFSRLCLQAKAHIEERLPYVFAGVLRDSGIDCTEPVATALLDALDRSAISVHHSFLLEKQMRDAIRELWARRRLRRNSVAAEIRARALTAS